MFIPSISLITLLKLLLIPAYRSTDFEVHRNWLALTYSLPVKDWYYEKTSEWTLDYPPFFAWFEYLLTLPASYFDENMLVITNLNYDSNNTVLFQRLSVIFMDFIYYYSIHRCLLLVPKRSVETLAILLLANAGLIMVDHVHFQYNGFMYGIMILSIVEMWKKHYLRSAFWFTFLLNLKHIYLYAAPAFFIYLLKVYIMDYNTIISSLKSSKSWMNCFKLGSVVISVFAMSFLPFYNDLPQVFSRLFPLKRGLCHAYWAPNFWALYNVADKICTKLLLASSSNETGSMTGGLVQEYSHLVLPNITPKISMGLSIIATVPCMIKLWKSRSFEDFLRCIVLCSLTAFMFGYHVHEKAILMAIIPLTILAVVEKFDAKVFLILSTVGHFSLFPLLFPIVLLPFKTVLFLLYTAFTFVSLNRVHNLNLLNYLEKLYLAGLLFVYSYVNFVHSFLGIGEKFPFLPLLFTSVYCSIGVSYCWMRYYVYFLLKTDGNKRKKV